ncbi:MAG: hypothetical protein WCP79_10625 [Bacillota bacterium]
MIKLALFRDASFKKIVVFVISLAFYSFLVCAANSDSVVNSEYLKAKPVVVTFYVNNAKSTCDSEILKKVTDRFNAKLVRYNLRSGSGYVDRLKKYGIVDMTTAERADIITVFTDENVDYVVYVEVQPVIIANSDTVLTRGIKATVTLSVKIIDVKKNKYLFNGKFVEQADNRAVFFGIGTKAPILSALDLILLKTDMLFDSTPL